MFDRETGERTVWFFGTTLDHWSIVIPKYLWRFPWSEAAISLDVDYENQNDQYNKFKMRAQSNWGEARIDVEDEGRKTVDDDFPGFPDKETALVYLT